MFKFFVATFVLCELSSVSSTNWCRLGNCANKPHLLCQNGIYIPGGAGYCGPQVLQNSVSATEQAHIIQKVNNACDWTNNSTLCFEWDSQLASMAQTFSNRCESQLNYCVNVEKMVVALAGKVSYSLYAEDLTIEYVQFVSTVKHGAQQFLNKLSQFENTDDYILQKERAFKLGCGVVKRNVGTVGNNNYEFRVICFFGLPLRLFHEITFSSVQPTISKASF